MVGIIRLAIQRKRNFFGHLDVYNNEAHAGAKIAALNKISGEEHVNLTIKHRVIF